MDWMKPERSQPQREENNKISSQAIQESLFNNHERSLSSPSSEELCSERVIIQGLNRLLTIIKSTVNDLQKMLIKLISKHKDKLSWNISFQTRSTRSMLSKEIGFHCKGQILQRVQRILEIYFYKYPDDICTRWSCLTTFQVPKRKH